MDVIILSNQSYACLSLCTFNIVKIIFIRLICLQIETFINYGVQCKFHLFTRVYTMYNILLYRDSYDPVAVSSRRVYAIIVFDD